jgi:hypothetical protein
MPNQQETSAEATPPRWRILERTIRQQVDTPQRTERLDELKAKRNAELDAIRKNPDLTNEARTRKMRELSISYDSQIREEAVSVM